jgi:putative ABC transport system permease protein
MSRRRRLRGPAIIGLRLGPLVSMYGWRLRRHGTQEALAAIGIAIGVALVFGVLVSSHSITGSTAEALRAITGRARLQLAARSPDGFDQRLVERVGQLPGVRVASPVLRADTVIAGPGGRRLVQLVGVTASQLALEGAATRHLGVGAEALRGGIGLPSGLAGQIGASAGGFVTLFARGGANRLPVRAVLGSEQVGSSANSPLVVALLPLAQRVLAEPERVTAVLVEPLPGHDQKVRAALRQLAAGRLDVQSAGHELAALEASAQPINQSAHLLAAIGAIVGFLFALYARLLTVPERRRWIAEARTQGYDSRQVILIMGFQALTLGLIASLAGLLLGDLLAHTLFSSVPSYLTLAFTVGVHPIISPSTVALALGAGLLATLAASAAPLRDLAPGRPIDAVVRASGKVGHSIGRAALLAAGALAATIILAATLLALVVPRLSIAGGVLLGLGVVCAVPVLLVAAVRGLLPAGERLRGSMLAIGLIELDGTATRSIALTGVAALAIYGSVAVQGARRDLLRGLDAAVVQYVQTADIWVTPTGENFLTVDSFKDGSSERAIARAPGVASVRTYQGSLLDVGVRRMWIRARPADDPSLIQSSQLLHGGLARATTLIRAGGWAAVPNAFAAERHLAVGDPFTLPAPAGAMALRVAAITTNIGWPPGAITINDRDYRRWWQTSDPTALEVSLRPGVSAQAGKRAVIQALSGRPGLRVQTRSEREAAFERSARQGVQSLGEISTLILIAAALAVTFALSAAITARRMDLAARKSEGFEARQLRRSLLLESAVVLGVGAIDGAILGLYAHALASRWLRSQGFPAPFSPAASQVLLTVAIGGLIALSVVALAGYLAARVPPRVSLQE